MRHGARILASKWREGVTPNGCRPFGEVCSSANLPSRPGTLPRTRFLLMSRAQRAMPTDFFSVGPSFFRVGLFIDGLETCLQSMANFCHLLAKSAN